MAVGRRGDGSVGWGKNRPQPRGKLGTKRSVVPVASPSASPSHVPDYKLLEETLDAMPVQRPETLLDQALNLCLDKGYDYDGPRQIAYDYNLTAHIRCRGEESKTLPEDPNYKPRHWVVERPGSTASDACSFAGRRSPRTTKLCSSLPVASSPGSKPPYWDRP